MCIATLERSNRKVSLAPDAIAKYEARVRRSKTLRKQIFEENFMKLLWEDRVAGKYTDMALVTGDGTR